MSRFPPLLRRYSPTRLFFTSKTGQKLVRVPRNRRPGIPRLFPGERDIVIDTPILRRTRWVPTDKNPDREDPEFREFRPFSGGDNPLSHRPSILAADRSTAGPWGTTRIGDRAVHQFASEHKISGVPRPFLPSQVRSGSLPSMPRSELLVPKVLRQFQARAQRRKSDRASINSSSTTHNRDPTGVSHGTHAVLPARTDNIALAQRAIERQLKDHGVAVGFALPTSGHFRGNANHENAAWPIGASDTAISPYHSSASRQQEIAPRADGSLPLIRTFSDGASQKATTTPKSGRKIFSASGALVPTTKRTMRGVSNVPFGPGTSAEPATSDTPSAPGNPGQTAQSSNVTGELWLDTLSLREWLQTYLAGEFERASRAANQIDDPIMDP